MRSLRPWRALVAAALACAATGCVPATGTARAAIAGSSVEPPPDGPAWHDGLAWQGRRATMQAHADGGFTLAFPGGTRAIPPQPLRSSTASALFDGLFAMAQAELAQDKVDAITDWSFNDQKPFPCRCFETGEKWHYVWTRDLSYAADLALARLDPERTKASLRFKLSQVRNPRVPQGLVVAQDTGSGGSWPVSTDRVVWFLAARHLLADDPAFRDEVWRALQATLAQDDAYAWDPDMALYRGETSFLDWREQTYPAWTATDTTWIAQSFSLSTNVLHVQALDLAAQLARKAGDPRAAAYAGRAARLRASIDRKFWREDRGLYASYLGPAFQPQPVESHDLLGTSLAVIAGVAPADRARRAIAGFPVVEAGSPVVWPQQPETAIYHNRAIWPFVSAYALRAARRTGNGARIAHEVRSLMRGAALAGSNMENYELATQAVHVEDGPWSGPVVNSPRQLWSVAGYLDMVQRGIFGLEDDGGVRPMIPAQLAPMLFGQRREIALQLPDRRIVLRRPPSWGDGLLVAASQRRDGRDTIVDLALQRAPAEPLAYRGGDVAPATPLAPRIAADGGVPKADVAAGERLYRDGVPAGRDGAPAPGVSHCYTLTRVAADGLESLPSPPACTGPSQRLTGAFPRAWTPPRDGRYRASFRYTNAAGPVNTGITAGVKRLALHCAGQAPQSGPIVLPHRAGEGDSTAWTYTAKAGVPCRFTLSDGTNMSDLAHFAHYTGGSGGRSGPLNPGEVGALVVAPTH